MALASAFALSGTCALARTVCRESHNHYEGPGNLTVAQTVNDTQGADDMSDHDEWISYSHWGMFTLERKSSN
jgi:hypothetical protein